MTHIKSVYMYCVGVLCMCRSYSTGAHKKKKSKSEALNLKNEEKRSAKPLKKVEGKGGWGMYKLVKMARLKKKAGPRVDVWLNWRKKSHHNSAWELSFFSYVFRELLTITMYMYMYSILVYGLQLPQ